MTSKTSSNVAAKVAYTRPALVAYGSVRNLTGGSGGSMMDSNGTKTQA